MEELLQQLGVDAAEMLSDNIFSKTEKSVKLDYFAQFLIYSILLNSNPFFGGGGYGGGNCLVEYEIIRSILTHSYQT